MLALIGSAIGIAGALLLSRVMRSHLFGVQPTDPATFVAGACGLVAWCCDTNSSGKYLPIGA